MVVLGDELLKKVSASPVLRAALTDPRCEAAIAEMQADPQAALAKYASVAGMSDLMGLMGDQFHFSGVNEPPSSATSMGDASRGGEAAVIEEIDTKKGKRGKEEVKAEEPAAAEVPVS